MFARSYQARLQLSFLALGLTAIAVTGWEASTRASNALRQSTYERLTAIRETKRLHIEDYFRHLHDHLLALSNDESTILALEEFSKAWESLPAPSPLEQQDLKRYYESQFAPAAIPAGELMEKWFPAEPRTIALQSIFLSRNPHPTGHKEMLLSHPSRYGQVHAKHHPTLHRYRMAFGFYDIFLITGNDGRILYTVSKEIDLGAKLTTQPFHQTGLAQAFRRAMQVDSPEQSVIEDYQPYIASHFAPAAFLATPIWRAGVKIGVIAIQVAVDEVNRVMTGDRNWSSEGLGSTGQAYIVGSDRLLRSDSRFELEQPETYLQQLKNAGVSDTVIARIQQNRTAVLTLAAAPEVGAIVNDRRKGTETGSDFRSAPVLRSFTPLDVHGLNWSLIAEVDAAEAFAPISSLRMRILAIGLLVSVIIFAAAWWLAVSITRPISLLSASARQLGRGDFQTRVPVNSSGEIGDLARSFNHMIEDLERTTVSRDQLDRVNAELRVKQQELERLAQRLLQTQEEERSRIARDLHDDLSQRLAALAISAGRLKQTPEDDPSTWREGLGQLQENLARAAGSVHGLARSLHPSTLDDLGLVAAVEGECRSLFERGGPVANFTHEGSVIDLQPDVSLGIYRIVQEALHNVFRHADAAEVSLHIRRSPLGVDVTISDDGRGFDRNAPDWKPGLGLASMQERAALLGGALTIESVAGAGTRLSLHIPLRETANA